MERALRIGTNHGSLSDRILNRYGDTPLGMVESALEFVRICEKNKYDDVILSMKSSNPKVMIEAYRLLAARMGELGMDYPFHLGVTEAGMGEDGRIKSAAGIRVAFSGWDWRYDPGFLDRGSGVGILVCRALARPFENRPAQAPLPDLAGLSHCSDPFAYRRRVSRKSRVGPFSLGENEPIRVIVEIPSGFEAKRILSLLEGQLKKAQGAPSGRLPDPPVARRILDTLKRTRQALSKETSRLAFLGRFEGPSELAAQGAAFLDAISVSGASVPENIFGAAAKRRIPVSIDAGSAEEALRQADAARRWHSEAVLSLYGGDTVRRSMSTASWRPKPEKS